MDLALPPCLRVLRHVYRRGPGQFQQCRSFHLGYLFVLVHFGHGCDAVDEKAGLYAIPHETTWIWTSPLVCGHFGMYTEEVLIGFNSVSCAFGTFPRHMLHLAHVRRTSISEVDVWCTVSRKHARSLSPFGGTSIR
jgi:hypothetical protein